MNNPRRILIAALLGGVALAGDPPDQLAPKRGPGSPWVHEVTPMPKPVFGTIQGIVTFQPDYRLSNDTQIGPGPVDRGHIPLTDQYDLGLAELFVCAYDHEGGLGADFEMGFPTGDDDDRLLGCTTTADGGHYSIEVERFLQETMLDLYLVTWYCSGPVRDIHVPGTDVNYPGSVEEVCVRLNSRKADVWKSDWSDTDCILGDCSICDDPGADGCGPDQVGLRTKYTRSPIYQNAWDGGEIWLNWNLSCPLQSETIFAPFYHDCGPGNNEPFGAAGDSGSNYGYNMEAVHTFRALTQPDLPYRPKGNTVAAGAEICDEAGDVLDANGKDHDAECEAPLYFYLAGATPVWEGPDDPRYCKEPAPANNTALRNGTGACLKDGPKGSMNPFRPIHEMGHAYMHRWMDFGGSFQDGCPGTAWKQSGSWDHDGDGEDGTPKIVWAGAEHKVANAEGWANFFAVAAWYDQDHPAPAYGNFAVEDRNAEDLYGYVGPSDPPSCRGLRGEGRETQFFWDLYDDRTGDDENMSTSMIGLLKTLSRFGPAHGNLEFHEHGEDGRNVQDFLAHYRDEFFPSEVDLNAAITLNCMQEHHEHPTLSAYEDGGCACPTEADSYGLQVCDY